MIAIADTGFLVAYLSKRDRHHEWAVALAGRGSEPFLTCDAVLAEAAFNLRSSPLVLAAIEAGLVRPVFDLAANVRRLARLAEQYRERDPDLADLCLIRMSEIYPNHPVMTVDEKDFRIYRRNGREAIPLLCPERL